MKRITFSLIISLFLSYGLFSQSNYCDGWKSGYKAGYCYEKYGCVTPVIPICPVQRIGETTFQDGYNRGFAKGQSDNSGDSNSKGGAYGQLKPLENTNVGSILENHRRNNPTTVKKKRKKTTSPPDLEGEYLVSQYNRNAEIKNDVNLSDVESKRQNAVGILNEDFKTFRNGNRNLNRIARTEDENLIISIKMPIDMKYKDFQYYENRFVARLCFVTSDMIINDDVLKEFLINELEYQNLIFEIELTCKGRKKVNRSKTLHKLSMENLKVPLQEYELYKVLF